MTCVSIEPLSQKQNWAVFLGFCICQKHSRWLIPLSHCQASQDIILHTSPPTVVSGSMFRWLVFFLIAMSSTMFLTEIFSLHSLPFHLMKTIGQSSRKCHTSRARHLASYDCRQLLCCTPSWRFPREHLELWKRLVVFCLCSCITMRLNKQPCLGAFQPLKEAESAHALQRSRLNELGRTPAARSAIGRWWA